MTPPLEARIRSGATLRIPMDAGCLRITHDARSGWFVCERCGADDAWSERVFYATWAELRDEMGSLLVGAREEEKR